MTQQPYEEFLRATLADAIAEVIRLERERCEEAAFHLTDWYKEFCELRDLYREPKKYNKEQQYRIAQQFLVHATEHLIAASEILLGYTPRNIFREDDGGS